MLTPELSEATRKCPVVEALVKVGATPDSIILLLVRLKAQLLQDVEHLKLLAPKRVKMSDGSTRIWRCQEEFIPMEEVCPMDIGDSAWALKQLKIKSTETT